MINKLVRRLKTKVYRIRYAFNVFKKLNFPFGKKVYIIGTPTHTNLGDSAIVIAQRVFLQGCGYFSSCIKEITVNEYLRDRDLIKRCISKKSLICGLGGGNMGNQWIFEDEFRYKFLQDFPKNRVVVFPQTIYYVESDNVEKEKEEAIRTYSRKVKLTIFVREEKSFDIIKEMFPAVQKGIAPDIVLSMSCKDFGLKSKLRNGCMFCMRNDPEKAVTDDVWSDLENFVKDNYSLDIRKTDMHHNGEITKENRFDVVKSKLEEFCKAELVITDRLHGMVFATITGTPCIVFGNYNHKVEGTYQWIKGLPYIQYVNTLEEAKSGIESVLKCGPSEYDSKILEDFYSELKHSVKK